MCTTFVRSAALFRVCCTQYGGGTTQTKEMDDEYNSFMAAIGEKKDGPGGGGGPGPGPSGGGGPGGPPGGGGGGGA